MAPAIAKLVLVLKLMEYLMLIALVVALTKTIWAIDAYCNFKQYLEPGITYYVYNSEYPDFYTEARSCRWFAKSATNVRLNCQTFSIPASPNCVTDRLSISPSGNLQLTDARNYCGTGRFNITSTGNSMNIVFTSFNRTPGGRFLCSLQATASTAPNCDCGWKKQTRLVGGAETGVNEYPMMAGLVDGKLGMVYCGATIISRKHALTTAHCRLSIPINQIGLLVGDHDTSTGHDTNATSIHRISGFLLHPSYNSRTQANDIAIVTVNDTIVFTLEVGPACLPFRHASDTFAKSKVDVLGWGTTEFAGPTSDVLQEVQLDVITISDCQEVYKNVTNNQMCTYTRGKDSCQFDSGGPLLWQNPTSMRLVSAGVVSYGETCADAYPAVNTRVGAYIDWILSVTPDVDYCRLE